MTDKEKKNKIADILMDFQEEYSNEVINRPMLASLYAGDILSFIDSLQEEPATKDFEAALAEEWEGYNNRGAAKVDALEDNTQELAFAKGFYRGAKWQKQQDQETIELAEDHAMLAGMEKMKQQMMAKAKSGTVQKYNQVILDDGTYIDLDPSMQLKPSFVGLKEGDKIKVIMIKVY